MSSARQQRPNFDALPLRKGDPPYSAWGLYGMDDEKGTLNLLTPEVVAEAAKEVKTGVRIGLDLPVNYIAEPSHGRRKLTHKVIRFPNLAIHDDEVVLNTQISTQWDGFRHYGYLERKLFYNGVTLDEISGPNPTTKLGLHAWCKEGIVGRGVLLDYYTWSRSVGKNYELIGDYAIEVEDLKACAEAQKVTFKKGDILLVRSGWKVGFDAMNAQEQSVWCANDPVRYVGVKTSVETARWLWDTGFSACAGDAPAWERFPLGRDTLGSEKLCLHEVMLNGWGMPIGEMFDLERLSEECVRQGRYTFLLTSTPLYIPGGVGSPPNAIAVF